MTLPIQTVRPVVVRITQPDCRPAIVVLPDDVGHALAIEVGRIDDVPGGTRIGAEDRLVPRRAAVS